MGQESSRIKVEYGRDVTFVTFLDERIVDEEHIRQIKNALDPVIEQNQEGKLVLNFSNVNFMTSALLGLLVRIHKNVCELNGQVQLSNLDADLYRIFEITKLTQVFDIT
ncbi:MAG: STAS domain-containing protein [Sedimentisphaerales bacterium]|nr:STAS domain-containing protein [Sedimentisphaerales bacterium]